MISDRLKEIRKKNGNTQEEFALKLGINRGAYKNYENSTSEPSLAVLKSISETCGIDLNWLILGQTHTHAAEATLFTGSQLSVRHLPNVTAWAGDVINIDENLSDVEYWLVPRLGIGNDTMYSFTVQGNSMEPTLRAGDLLLCEPPIGSIADLEPNAIYVVVYTDGVRVKRLRRAPSGGVLLQSDNQAYRDELVAEGHFSALRVMFKITKVRDFF